MQTSPLIWSRDAFIAALALTLLHSLWQGAVVGAANLALRRSLKHSTPDMRGGVSFGLLSLFFATWLGTFVYFYQQQTHPAVTLFTAQVAAAGTASPTAAISAPFGASLAAFYSALVTLWALGICVLSLRHFVGFFVLRRLQRADCVVCTPAWQERAARMAQRLGLRRAIKLLSSAHIDVPFVFGLLRPVVMLPLCAFTRLTPTQIEALIAHELSHLVRHDVIVNALQMCMETILFYHPAVRPISLQIRAAREQRCDDLAIQIVGDRLSYARALYTLDETRTLLPQLALSARGDASVMSNTHLLNRIQRILGAPVGVEKSDLGAQIALILAAATIGLATLAPVQAHPLNGHKEEPSVSVTALIETHTEITLALNGDKYKLMHGSELKPNTPLRLNDREIRFSRLTPNQRTNLKQALSGEVHKTSVQSTKYIVKSGDDTFVLESTELKPGTHLKLNGKEVRFISLTEEQQEALTDSEAEMRAKATTPAG